MTDKMQQKNFLTYDVLVNTVWVSICKDSDNAASIIPLIDKPLVTYGIESDNVDFKAKNIIHSDGKVTFDVIHEKKNYSFSMNIPGSYNVLNALAAISVCKTMGLSIEDISKSLKDFSGEIGRAHV